MAVANRAVANIATYASAISNMEDLIAQVLEKQLSVLESVVYNAIKGALTEFNASLQHIRAEPETEGTMVHVLMEPDYGTFTAQRQRELEEPQHEIHARSTPDLLVHPATRRVTHGGREFAFTAATDVGVFCRELEDGATTAGGTLHLVLGTADGPRLADPAAVD